MTEDTTVTAREKLARYIKESGKTPAYWQAEAGITSNRPISQIMNGGLEHSYHMVVLAQAMGLSLDWLFDEAQGFPPQVAGDGRGVILSPEQSYLLDLATRYSAGDPEPDKLVTATDRLLGIHDRTAPGAGESIPPAETTVRPVPRKAGENGSHPKPRKSSAG
jgi:hypothetical protein